jgi:putative ABC transport system substrate-binding protein
VKRRKFFALAGGAVASGALLPPLRAQQGMPVVGYVRSTTAAGFANLEAALRTGLNEAGFVEGRNVIVESHYADNRPDRLSALIADLVRRPVNVIVSNIAPARVAKAATKTVPIVFVSGSDPVGNGLVTSLNRPGGNVTGVTFLGGTLATKRLGLLHQLVPRAMAVAALLDPNGPAIRAERRDLPVAAQAIGLRLLIFDVDSGREIEAVVATAVKDGAGALFVGGGAFLNSQRNRLVALAARHKLPTSFIVRENVVAGGLMSYGPSQSDAYRQAGIYVGRILKGETPAELPVMQSAKFEFVLNLGTAKALGLDVAPAMLALADEVID